MSGMKLPLPKIVKYGNSEDYLNISNAIKNDIVDFILNRECKYEDSMMIIDFDLYIVSILGKIEYFFFEELISLDEIEPQKPFPLTDFGDVWINIIDIRSEFITIIDDKKMIFVCKTENEGILYTQCLELYNLSLIK